ncbi:40S ribosomal protein S10 [Spraguea lophii 42_110]|uniref:40S ribosomal protein S10 n=1 Tax=Spraguea lophii (strain 42_110) TaxID=1358809 RepID=S7XU48_SPRLO|nr:Chain SK0, 40S ribosomal protein S10 [Spraguea lophii 42_110]7QJH_RK0 Chain RK0, 40S ribosomal protein S10 [Spraguea lophii 42_110]7QJH_SK0 Chain SK0, 40S ribosomal protein S10 [Spraguea lophii 42_110]8BR3_SK0 Chain SK0, 40S ribosomal protein S10 [Spraguea lophii 42_110]8P5D_SK0 Chain SK0, 40S ribosomal protein S10 [Spraguea lophii 42_110]8P60_RK0 Chain RK0, 40S ribosomal protein S10 [Spraguea lophii 42_110]8P60_SK0 Chain SK0, 40S ribosomal protein S10 [Spraguea lophii 42_110]EPR79438.1 4
MQLSREDQVAIRKYLFRESICLVKDKDNGNHPELNINNKQVMKFLRSYVSRGLVEKVFVWQHAYFLLKSEGVDVLREELYLDETEVPLTYMRETYEAPKAEVGKVQE